MTVSDQLRERIRLRANLACEYCSVSEADTGSLLTVDHFQPQAHGGDDGETNLLYCCHACNSYTADYWPTQPDHIALWNPRHETREVHMLALAKPRPALFVPGSNAKAGDSGVTPKQSERVELR